MNTLRTRDLTLIAMIVVLMVVGGWMLFTLGAFLGVPGLKYVLMGPYLSFCLYFPDRWVGGRFLLTWISLVFGMIMMLVSPFMGPAIVITGFLTDLLTWPFQGAGQGRLALYPTIGFLLTYWVTTHLTGLMLLGPLGWLPALMLAGTTFVLGWMGVRLARLVFDRMGATDGLNGRS